jgi:hypothetical protein
MVASVRDGLSGKNSPALTSWTLTCGRTRPPPLARTGWSRRGSREFVLPQTAGTHHPGIEDLSDHGAVGGDGLGGDEDQQVGGRIGRDCSTGTPGRARDVAQHRHLAGAGLRRDASRPLPRPTGMAVLQGDLGLRLARGNDRDRGTTGPPKVVSPLAAGSTSGSTLMR